MTRLSTPDLVDIFDGADPGDDPPAAREVQCEVCGYWTSIEVGLDEYDIRCEHCGDRFLRTSEPMAR